MKYFALIAAMIVLPVTALSIGAAHAQTRVSPEQANSYYASCRENAAATEMRFSPAAQDMFCACTAAQLTQNFTIEDMQVMTDPQNPNAREALNRMIVQVYAPCMEEPTREYHYNSCVGNPQVSRLNGNPEQLCRCAADSIAAHLKQNGPRQFQEILARDPNVVDPMQALYDDPAFRSFAQSQLLGCVR